MPVARLWLCLGCLLFGPPGGYAGEPTIHNTMGMDFVSIPSGEFVMGTPAPALVREQFPYVSPSWLADETPGRRVRITRSFYMGVAEVTQEQWQNVMHTRPGPAAFWERPDWPDLPVVGVSWYDSQLFIEALGRLETGFSYRLPTEAEWEYAARAGHSGVLPFPGERLRWKAWYYDNSGDEPQVTGALGANPWGVSDMLGNAWEWVSDWYAADAYGAGDGVDPKGPDTGVKKVIRGGSYHCPPELLRPAYREAESPTLRDPIIGFRLVLERAY